MKIVETLVVRNCLHHLLLNLNVKKSTRVRSNLSFSGY